MPALDDSQLRVYARQLQYRIDELEKDTMNLRTTNAQLKLQTTIASSKAKAREYELLMKVKNLQRLLARETARQQAAPPLVTSTPLLSVRAMAMRHTPMRKATSEKKPKKAGVWKRIRRGLGCMHGNPTP